MKWLKSRMEGLRYRVFYPSSMKFPKEERYRLTDSQVKIIDIIQQHDGIMQKDIAKKLQKKPQTINYNIKVLQDAGLIKIRKRGRRTTCHYIQQHDDNQKEYP